MSNRSVNHDRAKMGLNSPEGGQRSWLQPRLPKKYSPYRTEHTTGMASSNSRAPEGSLGGPSQTSDSNEKQTEVGSYFVANYPPFSFWSQEHLPAVERVLSDGSNPTVPLGLYLHIPFCRKRCKFCYFRVYTEKNSRDVENYADVLTAELALYRRYTAFSQRPLRFVYFGGGTPSFLSTRQLISLVEKLRGSVKWGDAEEVTFECEPGTLNRAKVQALKEIGVTRMSLGVENFDDAILRENGRAHESNEIYRAYEWIEKAGFSDVNIDLIAGMVGETEENWQSCVRKTIELSPDSVTIYQMELPYNTVYSQEIRVEGQPVAVAGWEQKRAWVGEAFAALERVGYRVSSGYTAAKGPKPAKFAYRDSLWHGADMVGIGVSSFSYLGGVHYQNMDRLEDYVAAVGAGNLPLKRALPIGDTERLIRELILQMKLGNLDLGYFREKFQRDVKKEFQPTFDDLRQKGYLDWEGDRVVLTREALLRVDALLPRFFLPEHRDARYT